MSPRWRRRHRVCRLLGMLLVPFAARQAGAQLGCAGSACTVEIAMPVVDVMRISLSTTSVGLGTPTESDYLAGFRDIVGAAITSSVKANRPYQVQVTGASGTFGYAGPHANPFKPASDLLWATSQSGLSTTTNHMGVNAILLNEKAGGPVQAMIYLRSLWKFTTDVPGAYSMSVRLTVSAP